MVYCLDLYNMGTNLIIFLYFIINSTQYHGLVLYRVSIQKPYIKKINNTCILRKLKVDILRIYKTDLTT